MSESFIKKAWLISWTFSDGTDDKDILILDCRRSSNFVKSVLELIYFQEEYSLEEQISYTKNKTLNPYKAEEVKKNGIPYSGEILCGHNPYLRARIVSNIKIITKGSEKELIFDESNIL